MKDKNFDIQDLKLRFQGRELGWCYREDDGFYVFSTFRGGRYFDAYILREMANYLDKLNEPLNKQR